MHKNTAKNLNNSEIGNRLIESVIGMDWPK